MIKRTLPYQPYKKDINPYAYVEVFKFVIIANEKIDDYDIICFEVCSKILFLNGEQIL